MVIIGALILVAAAIFLIVESVHISVYGWPIDEDELDMYLDKHLDKAEMNPYSQNGTLFSGMPRYVARSQSFLTKWHIEGYGTIPRWSKWTEVLDKKRLELFKVKKLSDY